MASASPASAEGTGRRYGLMLLALVVLGGILRFGWMDRPCLWGDEAATYRRITGNFGEMLESLRGEGFLPLHYELYWLAHRFFLMTPAAMRMAPAVAGTLMIPAMYFLARQMAHRRVALLAAAFTAGSAYMLIYSRDAKMYMEFWLFQTLSIGCLLWWLRTHRRVAWLAWVASGLAALGLHAAGLIMLAVYPLMLLTGRRPGGKTIALFILGLLLLTSGPAGYYLGFSRWSQASGGVAPGTLDDEQVKPHWGAGGLGWIEPQIRGKSGWELVRHSTTAYLFGWSRAEEYPTDGKVDIAPTILMVAGGTFWCCWG